MPPGRNRQSVVGSRKPATGSQLAIGIEIGKAVLARLIQPCFEAISRLKPIQKDLGSDE
jgi:hypothetical protein